MNKVIVYKNQDNTISLFSPTLEYLKIKTIDKIAKDQFSNKIYKILDSSDPILKDLDFLKFDSKNNLIKDDVRILKDYKNQKENDFLKFYDSDEIRNEVYYGATLNNNSEFKNYISQEIVAETPVFPYVLDNGDILNVTLDQMKLVFKAMVKNIQLLFQIKKRQLKLLKDIKDKKEVSQWLIDSKNLLLEEKSKQIQLT